jgi:hypothetical protein
LQKSISKRIAVLEVQRRVEEEKPLDESDANQLTDDQVLGLATEGLSPGRTLRIARDGTLHVTFSRPSWGPRYWQRIAERAQLLCKERNIILVPANTDQLRQFLGYIESGVFIVHLRQPQSRYGHESCININYDLVGRDYNSPESSARSDLLHRITDVLDDIMCQVQGELLTTTDEVIEVLHWVMGEEIENTRSAPKD